MTDQKDMTSNDDMPELKPCPFCGAVPTFNNGVSICDYSCPVCDCVGPNSDGGQKEALEKWNTRADTAATTPAPVEQYDCDYCDQPTDVDDFVQMNEDGDQACKDCMIRLMGEEIERLKSVEPPVEAVHRETLLLGIMIDNFDDQEDDPLEMIRNCHKNLREALSTLKPAPEQKEPSAAAVFQALTVAVLRHKEANINQDDNELDDAQDQMYELAEEAVVSPLFDPAADQEQDAAIARLEGE